MHELNELYQEVILDHNKNPRNFGELPVFTNYAKGHNPLCGDQVDVYVLIENGIIKELKFSGSGCAISKASASIMTTLVTGKTVEEAKNLYDEFHKIVTSDIDEELDTTDFDKMSVFCGVREFPARVKCASLAWRTMISALDNANQKIITENNELK